MWRGRVASAIRGKRGQALLRDCLTALDAMPEKVLIANDLIDGEGDGCLLGKVGEFRGVRFGNLDPEEHDIIGKLLNISPCMVMEIEYINDESGPYDGETPEQRFERVRKWVVEQIR